MKYTQAFPIKRITAIVKSTVLAVALCIILIKLNSTSLPNLPQYSISYVFIILLSVCNWLFEIIKWKSLANTITKISFYTALTQSLAAHTAAISTPNKIGEYGAKALFFKKPLRKRIIALTFISNAYQLMTTIVFGLLGFYFYQQSNQEIPFNTIVVSAFYFGIAMALYYYLHITSKTKKIAKFLKKVSVKTQIQTGIYSIVRYLTFSLQYYLFLHLFGVNNSLIELFPLIWIMYFISSCIPSFALADFAIKGSVAIYLLSEIAIPESSILSTAFLMWILNFAVPALIGGFFVASFKTENQLGHDHFQ